MPKHTPQYPSRDHVPKALAFRQVLQSRAAHNPLGRTVSTRASRDVGRVAGAHQGSMRSSRGPVLRLVAELVVEDPEPRPEALRAEPRDVTPELSGTDSPRFMSWCAPWPTVMALYVGTCTHAVLRAPLFTGQLL